MRILKALLVLIASASCAFAAAIVSPAGIGGTNSTDGAAILAAAAANAAATFVPLADAQPSFGTTNVDSLIRLGGLQLAFVPPLNTFSNTLVIGNGGRALSTSPPYPVDPLSFELSGVYAGQQNTFVGILSGWKNTTGNGNTFIGNEAGEENTIGDQNTFLGWKAGALSVSGYHDTYLGAGAGQSATKSTNYHNTFVGTDSGLNSDATGSTFVGSASGTVSKGPYNCFFGYLSGNLNSSGSNNTFYGTSSGAANVSGNFLTSVGFQSLPNNTGSYNSAVGSTTLNTHTSGDGNTAMGHASLFSDSTSRHNTGFGYDTLFYTTSGTNTAVGAMAGLNLRGLGRNTFLGAYADVDSSVQSTLVNGLAVGYNAKCTNSNEAVIGSGVTVLRIDNFKFAVTTTTPVGATLGANGVMLWNSNAVLYVSISVDGNTVTTTKLSQ